MATTKTPKPALDLDALESVRSRRRLTVSATLDSSVRAGALD